MWSGQCGVCLSEVADAASFMGILRFSFLIAKDSISQHHQIIPEETLDIASDAGSTLRVSCELPGTSLFPPWDQIQTVSSPVCGVTRGRKVRPETFSISPNPGRRSVWNDMKQINNSTLSHFRKLKPSNVSRHTFGARCSTEGKGFFPPLSFKLNISTYDKLPWNVLETCIEVRFKINHIPYVLKWKSDIPSWVM